jgi:predicted RNA-binding Zn-ribbon protein involved in translation (DUF1610 family)
MKHRESAHSHCAACGEPIHYGQPAVNFCRNTEQRQTSGASSCDEVTVMESLEVLTLCVACGDTFNAAAAAEILRTEIKRRRCLRN